MGTHQAGAVMVVWWRQAETMAPVGDGGTTVVAYEGDHAREACNTLGFLEEQRERREGHQS
jgi:hypothetical protein